MGKLKIGVFGAHRGMTMIRQLLHNPDAEVTAICDKFVPALNEAGKTAEDAGLKVGVWTVNDAVAMTNWLAMGVDFITSDYPEQVTALLK